jgi:glutaconate CoA-transferase, subunit B
VTARAQAEFVAGGCTLAEMMVIAAAREIREAEVVFVGMRLPLLAFLLARRLHAPAAIGLYENGVIRETPAAAMLFTMADLTNLRGATFCGEMLDVMALLQQGRVDVGLLGTAEVDRNGNLNTTWSRRAGRDVRLPGSGGACDIACLARRTVVLVAHERERLVERVGYVTSPGYGEGKGWRSARGLPEGSGPAAIVTNLGVLRFAGDGEAYLASVHPGVRLEDVLARTGWALRVADDLCETPPPAPREREALRAFDPDRFWTG